MPSAFITLDGLDGTGKSTQCRLLADWLRGLGLPVTLCADPGGTALGAKLRELLLFGREHAMSVRTEALLFMASRAELVEQVIRPALGRGGVVVSDRFVDANVVYQGHAGGLAPAEVRAVGSLATGGLVPDLSVFLDLPVTIAAARRGRPADRMEGRGTAYMDQVRAGFLREADRDPGRIAVVDAGPAAGEVQAGVRRLVGNSLRSHGFPIPPEV